MLAKRKRDLFPEQDVGSVNEREADTVQANPAKIYHNFATRDLVPMLFPSMGPPDASLSPQPPDSPSDIWRNPLQPHLQSAPSWFPTFHSPVA